MTTHTPRSLSDSDLLTRAQTLAVEERRVALELLLHLREIERRGLHLARGFSSLFDYLTRELRYSEGAAYRRLESMRALRDVPELAPAIESGAVSLTTVAQVQSFLKAEKPGYTTEQKRELFEQIQHKSKREVEQVLASISPAYSSQPPEKARVVAGGATQITFVADAELMALLEKFKNLTSHSDPNPSYLELFKRMARLAVNKVDPAREPERKVASPANPSARRPGQPLRREIWRRDQARCTYQDPKTGRVCGSGFQVQVDHRQPWSRGGTSTIGNLKLLCANHNRWKSDRRD